MNILIVDDIELNRKLQRVVLVAAGFKTFEAGDGVEALDILEHEKIDLIISDILMPRMDGYRLCYEIRKSEKFKTLPFIIYTATYTSPDDEKLSLDIGADKYIKKPEDPIVLVNTVRQLTEDEIYRKPRVTKTLEEMDIIKEYNQRLVVKLEKRNIDLEIQTRLLQEEIDQRAKAEEEVIKLKLGIENSYDSIIITDTQGNITQVNPTFEKIYGYTQQEVLGKTMSILKSGLHPQKFYEDLWKNLLTKTAFNTEFINKTKDGRLVTVEASLNPILNKTGKLFGFLSIQRDITERKQAEEALRGSEERYRTLAEAAHDSIFIVDHDGIFQYINIFGAKSFNLLPADMIGKSVFDVFPKETAQENLLEFNKVFNTRMPVHSERELQFDNQKKWMSYKLTPIISESGEIKSILGIARDITVHKQAQRVNEILSVLGKQLSEVTTPKEVAKIILDIADDVFGWDACALEILNEAEDGIETIIFMDTTNGERKEFIPAFSDGMMSPMFQRILNEGPLLILRNESELKEGNSKFTFGDKSRKSASLMYVPIRKQKKNIGVLTIQSYKMNAYNSKDIDLLQVLANHCSGALERTSAEQARQIQLQRITALRNIDMAIANSLDLKVTLDIVLKEITLQLKVDAVVILLMNPHTQILEHVASRGFNTPGILRVQVRLGEGFAGKSALERKIIHIPDLDKEKTNLVRFSLLEEEGFVTCYCVPLIAKGNIKGVLEVFHRKHLVSNFEWVDYLNTMAGQAAIAIDSAELFNNLQFSNTNLLLSYDTTIEGWSKALDLRDKETEGHTLRVTEMTMQLAKEMGIREEELIHIRRGALLHDIGKMGIPDNILLKPGKLTEEEWVIMKMHPVYAYDLLYPIPYLRPALDIPYSHHEKWDGSGYPRGLKGEMIPLSARIFAIVDVWDALRSDRPYRKAWDKDKTLEHIKSGSGSHFDPKVVDAFFKMKSL